VGQRKKSTILGGLVQGVRGPGIEFYLLGVKGNIAMRRNVKGGPKRAIETLVP